MNYRKPKTDLKKTDETHGKRNGNLVGNRWGKTQRKSKWPGKTADQKIKRTTTVQRKSQRNGITRRVNERRRAGIQTGIP